MAEGLKTERLQLLLPAREMHEVAEYRWRNRVPSLTEAARQLIAKGLENEKAEGTGIPSASN